MAIQKGEIMAKFKVITDSSCDLPMELCNLHQIHIVPFYSTFDQMNYKKEHLEITPEEFYKELKESKKFPKTSLPSVADYMDAFLPYVKAKIPVLCITISSVFSGSYQSAVNAREIILDSHEDAVIEIVNSRQACVGQGLVVLQAAYMAEAGYSIMHAKDRIKALRESAYIYFTVGTLEYLQRGGRIGKVSSLVGSLFQIKPLITMEQGELHPKGTARGRKKSLQRIFDLTKEFFDADESRKFEDYDFVIASCVDSEKEAAELRKKVEALIGRSLPYDPFCVGITIGTYTGPDPVGIAFIKKYDRM